MKLLQEKLNLNKESILSTYLSGKTQVETARLFTVSEESIRRLLKKCGVKTRERVGYNKYSVDKTYFKSLDSEEKAYFLGWLYSDGCIAKHSSIILSLSEKDRKILDLFRDSIKSEAPVSIQVTKPNRFCKIERRMAIFRFSDKDIYRDLETLGMRQRKSLDLDPPKIEEKYLPAFLRGFFEGDGTVGLYKRVNSLALRSRFSFLGTKNMVDFIEEYLNRIAGITFGREQIKNRITKKTINLHKLIINRQFDIEKTLDLMYKDCGKFFLDRKYNIYKEIKAYLAVREQQIEERKRLKKCKRLA